MTAATSLKRPGSLCAATVRVVNQTARDCAEEDDGDTTNAVEQRPPTTKRTIARRTTSVPAAHLNKVVPLLRTPTLVDPI